MEVTKRLNGIFGAQIAGRDEPFRSFQPADTLRRRAETSDTPWRRWADDGHVHVIPGAVIDEDVIEATIRDLCDRYAVREIAFDPKFAARLMARLGDDGLPVVEHPQSSMHFTEGITEFQRAVIGRQLRHGGHPVLRWCVANVAPVTTDTCRAVRVDG